MTTLFIKNNLAVSLKLPLSLSLSLSLSLNRLSSQLPHLENSATLASLPALHSLLSLPHSLPPPLYLSPSTPPLLLRCGEKKLDFLGRWGDRKLGPRRCNMVGVVLPLFELLLSCSALVVSLFLVSVGCCCCGTSACMRGQCGLPPQ